MKKRLSFTHLDSGKAVEVTIEVFEEAGHYGARVHGGALRAPVFYGSTPDQAERQLRKVFEREHELVREEVVPE